MKCNICALKDTKPCYECHMCMGGDSHFRPIPNAKKKTNADKIRAMSDEELAQFLDMCEDAGSQDSTVAIDENGNPIRMIYWLQQPAEEET